MLEEMLDAPLWVPRFRPSIPHLTYQYHLFLNYLNHHESLQRENAELPPEEPKIRAALAMANDLRESETQFAAQMRNRDRTGEKLLPDEAATSTTSAASGTTDDAPIRVMKWTRIPEGLTMYANGAETPPPATTADLASDFGPEVSRLVAFRSSLETFKKGVDQSQRLLDQLLKLTTAGKTPATNAEAGAVAAARSELLDSMAGIVASLTETESSSSSSSSLSAVDVSLFGVMSDCVREYREVPIVKERLQELAADATRKFKSPIFNRQKDLLQEIKRAKAEFAEKRENQQQ
jgi:hypothetical protein